MYNIHFFSPKWRLKLSCVAFVPPKKPDKHYMMCTCVSFLQFASYRFFGGAATFSFIFSL